MNAGKSKSSGRVIQKVPFHVAGAILSAITSLLFLILAPILYSQAASAYPQLGFSSINAWTHSAILIGLAFLFFNAAAVFLGNERIVGLLLRAVSQVIIAYYIISVIGRRFAITVQGTYHLSMSIYYIALIMAAFALLRILPSVIEHIEFRGYASKAAAV